jgi:hypothetical protein
VGRWFKNHARTSTHVGNRKREVFKLKQETRKLSDAQRFSKLYYQCHYKKPVTSKWRETYLAHYKYMKDDLTATDVKE